MTTKVPTALSAGVELLTSELDFGVWQKTSLGLGKSVCISRARKIPTYDCHLGIDLKTKVRQVRILVPLEHADSVVDGLNALLGTSDGELDHGSGLNLSAQ